MADHEHRPLALDGASIWRRPIDLVRVYECVDGASLRRLWLLCVASSAVHQFGAGASVWWRRIGLVRAHQFGSATPHRIIRRRIGLATAWYGDDALGSVVDGASVGRQLMGSVTARASTTATDHGADESQSILRRQMRRRICTSTDQFFNVSSSCLCQPIQVYTCNEHKLY